MGGGSAPPAPDYAAAARETAAGNERLNTAQTYANRPNITTPWGSVTWSTGTARDPTTGEDVTTWNTNMSLTPAQQAALDSQQAIQRGRSEAAQRLLTQATDSFNTPLNFNDLPARANPDNFAADLRYNQNFDGVTDGLRYNTSGFDTSGTRASTVDPFSFGSIQRDITGSRNNISARDVRSSVEDAGQIQRSLGDNPLAIRERAQNAVWDLQRPLLDQDRASLENQLSNQGIARGTEAWNNAMRASDDARARAQLQAVSAGREEAAQMFGQLLQSGQFANSAQNLQFNQNMASADLFNRANSQRFGQELTAQGQNFNQDLQAFQFGNSAQQQAFNQGMAINAANNAAAAQNFNQNMTAEDWINRQNQNLFNARSGLIRDQNSATESLFNARMRLGAFQNTNRANALSERIQQRTQPLNELNALLTGQQVSQPGFQSFNLAGRSQGADLLNAATQQGNAMLNAANFEQAQNNQTNAALASAAMAAAMYFSDIRLKEDIQTIGILSSGVRVVHYRYRGLPGRYVGVIAQELALVQPDAVALHPSGYFVVDYSKV